MQAFFQEVTLEMKRIYLDNAATSFPKAPGVAEAVYNYLTNVGSNVNRGVYDEALEAEETIFETRELLCELFNFDKPENVIFTKNITESLNVLINGLFKPGDHVLISAMEHNAVTRPLHHLAKKYNGALEITVIPCNETGELPFSEEHLLNYLRPETKAVIMSHASNVCGTVLPLEWIGNFCREHNLFFIIDTAQTAGFLDIDFSELRADALAFTGHKGLLGPQGTGGFLVNSRLARALKPLIVGGTGSNSENIFQPEFMPDRFEAGTLNIPGIYGLNAALKYIKSRKLSSIREKELFLTERFLNKILNVKGVEVIGRKNIENRTAVISLDFPDRDNALVSHFLYKNYGILNRCGLHCAPLAHKTLGTFPQGTVRLSFSHFNTAEEIDYAVDAIFKCLK